MRKLAGVWVVVVLSLAVGCDVGSTSATSTKSATSTAPVQAPPIAADKPASGKAPPASDKEEAAPQGWRANAASTRIVGVLGFDGVLTSDITAPLEVFGAAVKKPWFADGRVVLLTPEAQATLTTEEGLKLVPDGVLDEDAPLTALIVPSSYDLAPLLKNSELVSEIRSVGGRAQLVSSNCGGAYLLAQAGLLDGRPATTWAGGEADFQKRYPKVHVQEDKNVVADGSVVTSNGSLVSYQAALVVLARLTSNAHAKEIFDVLQMGRMTDWSDIEAQLAKTASGAQQAAPRQ